MIVNYKVISGIYREKELRGKRGPRRIQNLIIPLCLFHFLTKQQRASLLSFCMIPCRSNQVEHLGDKFIEIIEDEISLKH